jgi:hypothetical protein
MEREGCEWASTDYQRGDVCLFDSLCLHQALPNIGDSIRLSLDYRYSGISQPVEVASLKPHIGGTWDEIYAGDMPFAKGPWRHSDYQFYWRAYPKLNVVEKVAPPPGSQEPDFEGDVCPARLPDGTPRVRIGAANINPAGPPETVSKL